MNPVSGAIAKVPELPAGREFTVIERGAATGVLVVVSV
jgi:hypothetical protein